MTDDRTDDQPRMKCGHTANATQYHKETDTRTPVCVICFGIVRGADEIDPDPPSLEGRTMACAYHREPQVPSDPSAAFFEHRLDADFDLYYCGCKGWD